MTATGRRRLPIQRLDHPYAGRLRRLFAARTSTDGRW